MSGVEPNAGPGSARAGVPEAGVPEAGLPEAGVPAAGMPAALRPFLLTGRVAVVTGASSGLGAGLARALASVGARVALVARRAERLIPLAEEIGGLAVPCDLLDTQRLAEVVPRVVDELGPPQILVNAAGTLVCEERAEDEPVEEIRRTFDLNLLAPFRLAQDTFRHMRELGGGSIVNVSSISGRVGIPGIPQASYAASKLGLSGLTTELAVQWARHSVRINTVAPGFFRSEITAPLYESEKGQQWLRRNTLLPTDGEVQDIVSAILWLVSDAGRYVTGQTIVVDGGWTAR